MLNSASLSLSLLNCVINGYFLNYPQHVRCAEMSGCLHSYTLQGTHQALLRSRCQQKRPDGGRELHFASYSWESHCNIHPPKFCLLSKEVLVKNIDAIVSPTTTLLRKGFVSIFSETITLRENAAK